MAQIDVSSLTFGYEGSFDTIFDNLSFSIDTDWKLGLIGRNGKGKTTFLNLLMNKYEYTGSISTNTVFDYFPYIIDERCEGLAAAEFMEEIKPNCEAWRVICELNKMGTDAEILYRTYKTLSFGERTKVMLAILFSVENDFLLIDEPTNHLDADTRDIVKKYLSGKKGFILVSHDRDLLDACIDHVLVFNRNSVEVQTGNFTTWWENKERLDRFAQSENEKHLKEISKLKAAAARTEQWAEKNEGTKIGFDPIKEHDRSLSTRSFIGAKTKKMQSRVKQMENRLDRAIDEKEGLLQDIEQPVDLKIMPLTHPKNKLITAYRYGCGYEDADSLLFNNMSFDIQTGDRVFICGSNGCGKSSLIKDLLREISRTGTIATNGIKDAVEKSYPIHEGELHIASNITVSYVNQDTSFLNGSITQFCKERNLDESRMCAILRQLDMDRVQFAKGIEEYSEGQKKKVLLAASLMTPAHLYIWDEPLNYIDVFSRMQIEKLLMEYQPTMLLVEHDVRFRDKIATKTINCLLHC